MKKNILKRSLATLTGLSLMASSLVNFPHIILADDSAEVVEEQTQDETVLEDAQIEQDVITESSSAEQTEQESEEVTQEETEVTEDSSMQEDATTETEQNVAEQEQVLTEQQAPVEETVIKENTEVVSESSEEQIQVENIKNLIAPKTLSDLENHIEEIKTQDLVNFSDDLKDAKDITFEQENDTKVLHIDGRLYVMQKGESYETDLETIQQRLIAQREEKDGIATYATQVSANMLVNFKVGEDIVETSSTTIYGNLWQIRVKASATVGLPSQYSDYTIENVKVNGNCRVGYYGGFGGGTLREASFVLNANISSDKVSIYGESDLPGLMLFRGIQYITPPTIEVKIKPNTTLKLETGNNNNNPVSFNVGEKFTPDTFKTANEEVMHKLVEDQVIRQNVIDEINKAQGSTNPQPTEVEILAKAKDIYHIEGWYTKPNMTVGCQPQGNRFYYLYSQVDETGQVTNYEQTQGTMPNIDTGLYNQDNVLVLYPRITLKKANITLDLNGGDFPVGKTPGDAQSGIAYNEVTNNSTKYYEAKDLSTDQDANVPIEPVKSGSKFMGWALKYDNNGTTDPQKYQAGQIISRSKLSGNLTLKATWQSLYCSVEFDKNQGTGDVQNTTQVLYSNYTLPNTVLTRDGYKFAGWEVYKKVDPTKTRSINYVRSRVQNGQNFVDVVQPGDVVNIEFDTLFKAKWTPYEYEITFNNAGNGSQKLVITEKTDSILNTNIVSIVGDKLNINLANVPTPYKQDNNFNGWVQDNTTGGVNSGTVQVQIDPNGKTTCSFTADFTPIQAGTKIAVKFNLDGGSFEAKLQDAIITKANTKQQQSQPTTPQVPQIKYETIEYAPNTEIDLTTLPTPTKENMLFTGWTISKETGNQGVQVLPTTNKLQVSQGLVFTANYVAMPSNLMIVTDGGTFDNAKIQAFENDFAKTQPTTLSLASVPTPSKSGKVFSGWELNQIDNSGKETKTSYEQGSTKTIDLKDSTSVKLNVLTAKWEEPQKQPDNNSGNNSQTNPVVPVLPPVNNGGTGGGSGAGTINPSVPNVPNTPSIPVVPNVPVAPNVPIAPQNPDSSNSNNGNNSNGTNGSNGTDNSNGADGTNGADSSNGSDSTQGGNGANAGNDNVNSDVNNNVNNTTNDNIDDILANLDESEENQINNVFQNMFDDLFSNFSSLFASSEFIQQNLLANTENENSNNQMFIAGLENYDNGQDNDGTNGSNSDKESFIKSKVLKPFFGFGVNKAVTVFSWALLVLIALIITYTVKKQIFSNKEEKSEEDIKVTE